MFKTVADPLNNPGGQHVRSNASGLSAIARPEVSVKPGLAHPDAFFSRTIIVHPGLFESVICFLLRFAGRETGLEPG